MNICQIKLVNKKISIAIANSSSLLKHFYSKIIDAKNKKISEIQKYDIKKEYLIQNNKLESLIKEYAITNKLPGKDLKVAIGKCLNFLNKDVKSTIQLYLCSTKQNKPGKVDQFFLNFKRMKETTDTSKETASQKSAEAKNIEIDTKITQNLAKTIVL